MKRACMIVGAFAWGLYACGGGAPAAESAPVVAVPQTQNSAPDTDHTSKSPGIAGARSELDRAEQQLRGTPQGDCSTACRALASMERAAEHICALESGSECGRARERVDAARERVRSTCGGCTAT